MRSSKTAGRWYWHGSSATGPRSWRSCAAWATPEAGLGEDIEATRHFDQALTVSRELGDEHSEMAVLLGLAPVAPRIGQPRHRRPTVTALRFATQPAQPHDSGSSR